MSSSDLKKTLRKRAALLRTVINSPQDKSQLTDALGVSRSTISRGLDSYEQHSCIEKRNGKYHATTTGRLVFSNYEEYNSTVTHLSKTSDIINSLPTNTSISSEFIKDVEKYPADPNLPGVALEARNEKLHAANRLLGLTSCILPSYPQELHEAVTKNEVCAEIVIEKRLINSLGCTHEDVMEKLKNNRNVTFFITEQELPYSLWIVESDNLDYAGITVYENGGVKGVLINHRKKAIDWAQNRYAEFRNQATVLE